VRRKKIIRGQGKRKNILGIPFSVIPKISNWESRVFPLILVELFPPVILVFVFFVFLGVIGVFFP